VISDGATGWFGLGPISVLPELQGTGIGTLLMQDALRLLRARGAAGCVVLGDPAYYSRFGFAPEASLVCRMCHPPISRQCHSARFCRGASSLTMLPSVLRASINAGALCTSTQPNKKASNA
jgi:hypothetical protein